MSLGETPQEAGIRFEVELAEKLGAQLTPGSGNQWHAKMDEQAGTVLLTLKATRDDRYAWAEIIRTLMECVAYVSSPSGPGGATLPAAAIRVDSQKRSPIDVVVMRAEDFAEFCQHEHNFAPESKADAKNRRARKTILERMIEEAEA